MTDLPYVALALVPGIGAARLRQLLDVFGTAGNVLGARQRDLQRVPGISRAAATAIGKASMRRVEAIVAEAESLDGRVLTPRDDSFPVALRDIPDPPTLLFAQGRTELLSPPGVAIVGSRDHSRYGAEACRQFAAGVARAGLTVVSGMARGIDAIAHQAALDADGGSVGVLGNGLGVIYPSANRALYERMAGCGCLITEFAPGERPNAGSFPRRNRLISGLAQVLLVVEAREKSGALITVDCALNQGKDVLVVPGSITSPVSLGCNRLIQSGAKPALGIRDVLEEFDMVPLERARTSARDKLSAAERRVMQLVAGEGRHLDEIAVGLGCSTAEALALATALEIRGLVVQDPGKMLRGAETVDG